MQVSKDSLETMWLLANFVRDMAQYQTELELRAFEEAEWGRVKEQDQARWLHSLSDLAVVHLRQERYEAAEEMNRRALEGREKVLGNKHPDTLTSVYCLAHLLHQKKDYAMAITLYERAHSSYISVLGSSHPDYGAMLQPHVFSTTWLEQDEKLSLGIESNEVWSDQIETLLLKSVVPIMQFSRQLRGSNPSYTAIVQKPQYSFSTVPLPMSTSVTTETLLTSCLT